MVNFEYDHNDEKAEYYELLNSLMERWETEIVEFKEARGNFDTDKTGRYFSAISNEANLSGKQYGWLILGVSEQKEKHPVGTSFKKGEPLLLEKFKYEISKDLTDGMTFLDIIELYPKYNGTALRVLMFKIPAAAVGIPTEWKNKYYARDGESLVSLQQYKIDAIRSQERRDWSKMIISGAKVEHLDKAAIHFARQKYKEKMNRPHISEEVDGLTDEEFLTKLRLIRDGNVTNAAMVLLGSPEHDDLMQNPPVITWRLFDKNNDIKDYEHFRVPFISVADKLLAKVRNLVIRYMPNRRSLFPIETQQYDLWLLRELLNNCIAHSNYQLGGRIYLNETEDKIQFANPGEFLPQDVRQVLKPSYFPPFYKNQLLAETMVNFHMIDTSTSGIKKVYRIQRSKYFPMPDYGFQTPSYVEVNVYGNIIDTKYTNILFDHPEFGLDVIYWLDLIQKGHAGNIPTDMLKYLRESGLVEGRRPLLRLSANTDKKPAAADIKTAGDGNNTEYYRSLIVEYLKTNGKACRKQINELLWNKLPDVLNEKQKAIKVATLLRGLRKSGIIATNSDNRQTSCWILADKKE